MIFIRCYYKIPKVLQCLFPSSTEFREWKYKISNSRIPVSFSGLRQDGKWPVLNGRELDERGSGLVLNARNGKFLGFSWKKRDL